MQIVGSADCMYELKSEQIFQNFVQCTGSDHCVCELTEQVHGLGSVSGDITRCRAISAVFRAGFQLNGIDMLPVNLKKRFEQRIFYRYSAQAAFFANNDLSVF